MTSETSTRRTFSKVFSHLSPSKFPSIKFSGSPERRSSHTPEDGDVAPEDGNPALDDGYVTFEDGNAASKDAQLSSVRVSSPQTSSQTINIVLFGETGVGKSSVINLIARKDIAKVSSDVNGCTMQSHCYPISFDNMDFAIYDTIGLEEPQMGVNGYLKAIEKAHELISKLSAAGGIHLLLFCMRGGRITATTQSNYRLFCECLCNTKVPIALVFTGLEREEKMEDWWMRNKTHIEHYGIKSNGHACITAVQDDDPVEQRKYEESQETIRKLLKSCATKGEAFSLESLSWFGGFLRKMKGFVPAKKSPKKKDILKVLTNRCKLDAETAKRIAEMMDKDDKDEEGGGGKDGPTNDTSLGEQDTKAASDVAANGIKEVARDAGPPQEPSNAKAVPGVVANGGKDTLLQEPKDDKASLGVVPVKEIEKNVADASALLHEVKAPLVVPNGGKTVNSPAQESRSVKASSVVPGKEIVKKNVADSDALQGPSSVKTPLVVPNGGKNVDGPAQESRSAKAPSVVPGKEVAKKNVADSGALQGSSGVKAPLVVPNSGKNVDGPAQESRSAKAPSVVPGKEVAKKNVADSGALQGSSGVKAPLVVPNSGKNVDGPAQESRSVKAPSVVPGKEATKKYATDGPLPQESIGLKAVPAVPSGGHDIAKKSVTSAGVPSSSNNFKAVGREAEKSGAKESIRRSTKKRGDSSTAGVTPASSQS